LEKRKDVLEIVIDAIEEIAMKKYLKAIPNNRWLCFSSSLPVFSDKPLHVLHY